MAKELENSLHSFFTVLWGQCSPGIQSKLSSKLDFLIKKDAGDCSWLLDEIRQAMFNFSSGRYPIKVLHEAKLDLIRLKQGRKTSPIQYYHQFMECVRVVECGNGTFGEDLATLDLVDRESQRIIDADPGPRPTIPRTPDDPLVDEQDVFTFEEVTQKYIHVTSFVTDMVTYEEELRRWQAKQKRFNTLRTQVAKDYFLGMLFVENADPIRFGSLSATAAKDYSAGYFRYATSAEDGLRLLSDHVPDNANSSHKTGGAGNRTSNKQKGRVAAIKDVSFLQSSAAVPGSDGRLLPDIDCWTCGQKGHYKDQCPTIANNVQLLQAERCEVEGDTGTFDLTFTQTTFEDPAMLDSIPPFSVLLDTGSTIESFKDSELLGNIRETKERVTALTNGGSTTYCMKGSFEGIMDVWYDPKGLANIISMKSLASVSHVIYDSSRENAFVATFADGKVWRFVEASNGLFVWNTVIPNKRNNGRVTNYCLVSTVADNEKQYHHREVDSAKLAGKLHRLLGYPAQNIFEHALPSRRARSEIVQSKWRM